MQFIDQAEIEVEGGTGGDGLTAFRREKFVPAGGPSGGTGGKGGSVVLVTNPNLQTLLDFRYAHRFKADDGGKGGPKNRTGASGDDLIVEVPCGTLAYDLDADALIGDLTEIGQQLVIAPGGKGGLGNRHFLSNRNRAPEMSQRGIGGMIRKVRLELKLLAEVGIIGLPNAGKSTLISTLSAAKPKVADYPFTTLIPNLGVVRKPTGDGTAIDPVEDYKTIQQELEAYGRGLPDRPQLLAINKTDALLDEEADEIAAELARITGEQVFTISAVSRRGTDELLQAIWQLLDETNIALKAAAEAEAQALIDFNTPMLRTAE